MSFFLLVSAHLCLSICLYACVYWSYVTTCLLVSLAVFYATYMFVSTYCLLCVCMSVHTVSLLLVFADCTVLLLGEEGEGHWSARMGPICQSLCLVSGADGAILRILVLHHPAGDFALIC
eukprot:SAG31_NODE_4581_length_3120_cov_2.891096_2_plen_120_part_00